MKNLLIGLSLTILLSGCAAFYTLEGVRYENATSFQQAVDKHYNDTLAQVTPLAKPLTNKKLIATFPSEAAIYAENVKRFTALQGHAPIGLAIEQITNLSRSNYRLSMVALYALKKRGIYSDVLINDSPSVINSLEPSKDYDVLYYTEPSQGSGQYFYASVKYGKQVFASDRSGNSILAKVNAFIDAAQAVAIRE